jgi:hypothetical protein
MNKLEVPPNCVLSYVEYLVCPLSSAETEEGQKHELKYKSTGLVAADSIGRWIERNEQ